LLAALLTTLLAAALLATLLATPLLTPLLATALIIGLRRPLGCRVQTDKMIRAKAAVVYGWPTAL
jgi:hypothetical protein